MPIKHNCPNCDWFFANWKKISGIVVLAFVVGAFLLLLLAKVGFYTITFQGQQILP